ncbi:MAG: GNAT family N-acetyltransferase [Marinoscillum sp.]
MISVLLANSKELQEKAFFIRREVFVVEQRVSTEDEFDEYEDISTHFVALDEANDPVGAARWRKTDKGVKLERFAVKSNQRGKGVGALLVEKVLENIRSEVGEGHYLYLHAQLPAVPLYEKFAFTKKGNQFLECDILHYLMFRYS